MLDAQMSALYKITKLLSENEVLWAIGGSILLRLSQVTQEADRIDVIISPEEIAKVDALLTPLGEKHTRVPSPHYATRFFCEYTIDGQQVHVMSGLTLHYKGFLYAYPFEKTSIVSMLPLEDIFVPCTALEDWYVLYQMMPWREERVKALEMYFRSKGPAHAERFAVLRRQPLPPAVFVNITRFLSLSPR